LHTPACAISQGRSRWSLPQHLEDNLLFISVHHRHSDSDSQNCQDEKKIEGHPCSLANLSTFKSRQRQERRESSSRHKPCATHIYLRLGIFLPGCTVFYPLFISYYTVDLAVFSLSISISISVIRLQYCYSVSIRILALPIKCPVPPLTFRGAARKRLRISVLSTRLVPAAPRCETSRAPLYLHSPLWSCLVLVDHF
jgi:hypothetical protein